MSPKTSVFASLSLLLAACTASPLQVRSVLHEKREYTPRQWTKGDRLSSDAILPMRIGLKQSNLEHGHGMLMDVYVEPSRTELHCTCKS